MTTTRDEINRKPINKPKVIATLPTDRSGEHEHCSVCCDDNVVLVIQGGSPERGTNCYYCDNTVVLCSKCAGQMLRELAEINLGLDTEMMADAKEWQPIETAPKDGTTVLLYAEGAVEIAYYTTYGKWLRVESAEGYCDVWHATHWMPLPEKP